MNVPTALEAITHVWRITAALARAAGPRTFCLAVGLATLFAQAGGQAQGTAQPLTPQPLPYSTSYLVKGDYAVGSVDFTSGAGTIPMSGVPSPTSLPSVPEHADILAAFLYWETIVPSWVDLRQIADLTTFRGRPIKDVRVKSVRKLLTGNTASKRVR